MAEWGRRLPRRKKAQTVEFNDQSEQQDQRTDPQAVGILMGQCVRGHSGFWRRRSLIFDFPGGFSLDDKNFQC